MDLILGESQERKCQVVSVEKKTAEMQRQEITSRKNTKAQRKQTKVEGVCIDSPPLRTCEGIGRGMIGRDRGEVSALAPLYRILGESKPEKTFNSIIPLYF